MSSRSILFTKKTDRILEEMGSQQREYFLDYLHNPLLLQGVAAGTPMRLWASTNNAASWLEVVLDSNAKVDIALWERPSRRSHDMPMDPSNARMALPLSMAGNSRASVDFRRTQETLGSLAYATIGAIRRDDMNLVEAMLGTLAQHIPWVEQITTLAHRVHPSAAVPHFLSSALTQMSLLADIHDPDAVRTMASPGTTAQALLAVHASKHTTPEPGVYALDSPGCPTTYLFVQHRLHSEDPFQARNTAWRIDQEGAHIWLDATGEPVFINAALRLGADALYPSPESQPDSQCPDWIPEGPSLRGVPAPLDNWSDTMAQGFTCGTRALCQQLANATPRALARGECLALVETWAQVQADASARWKDCVSKVHRRQPAFSKYSAAEQCLALWAQYAALVWAEHYPKKHAVLQTLLPKINSFGTMDEWRRQMAAMSAGNVHAARARRGLVPAAHYGGCSMNNATDPNTFIGADNQIAHLLAAPFIRDAQEITWYAAGAKDTWLRITKANGQVDIEAFERNKMALLGRGLPLEEFRHRSLIPDPAEAGMSEDLSRNLYAIGQLAMANYDAWHRSDWKVHTATLTLLAQHVPSVADVCERAKTIDLIGAHPSQDFKYAIGQAMHELDAIEALSDDPRGLATLDPWFRAQQLVRVASKAHPDTMDARETKLYAFESGGQKSFLMVSPVASEECPGFNMWLDSAMTPLLIDYHKNGAAVYLEKPGYTWEIQRPLPATVAGWNDAMVSMGAINNAPFESLKTGTMHALTFEENLSAIEAWADNPQAMAAWDHVDDPRSIVFLGQWALSTWVSSDPKTGQLLQSLLPEIDVAGSPGQLDPWRQLLVMARSQGINSPVDSIDLASVMVP